ncbi:MAG: alanine--tRNA ligase [Schleiferiaceae bacterium]|nr:alanine--tRNA ligase [Schleiferiaceae bacterium]
MLTSSEIRKKFLEFFNSKSHHIVPSAPIVIKNDPTLMFTNAGMNQFKDLFLGHAPAKHVRVADTQKCLRVSGKHNDLEEVGMDTYHHTMFEMLGNWSFGDYFKKEAIDWAWELLVKEFGIDPKRLYATVFEGDSKDGLDKDMEAFGYWEQYLPKEHILFGNKKDNFWEMGETGPCGPASELHVDLRNDDERAKVDGADLVNMDHPQVVEIWNLVFMEFNRKANGSLEALPNKHVDTGMGFERLCMVLQNKQSNYDTDVFSPIINAISKISNVKYGANEKSDVAIRVIADHVRAVAFAIADGQLPSNTGAGYVIRRILRRAIRYGYAQLHLKQPFIYQLVDVLVSEMGDNFKELKDNHDLVKKVIEEEESSFLRTVEQGLVRLDQIMKESADKKVDGAKAFELYDTFGFPFDLTQLILREFGFNVNESEFDAEMQRQKERSRAATQLSTDDWVVVLEDDHDEFIGYDQTEAQVKITQYRKVTAKKKTFYQLMLNFTPFYPEGGGQVGDTGILESEHEKIVIFDTKKENGRILHFTEKLPEFVKFPFTAQVNTKKRELTQNNHSATHLLHESLREVLGDHVEQKGSLVKHDHLRFDFSHFQKVSKEEVKQIEYLVNSKIRANFPLEEYRNIPMEEANEMGAMALFGEKYGDTVRAIKFGSSIELCGGTHVSATGNIGLFVITQETAVAAGIRRIEAITAEKSMEFLTEKLDTLAEVETTLKNRNNVVGSIVSLQKENATLQKQIEALLKEKAGSMKTELLAKAKEINGVQLIAERVELDPKAIKDLAFELKNGQENLMLVLANQANGKIMITVALSKKLLEKDLHAGKIVKELAAEIGGGGGGQAEFATAGGKNADGIDNALAKATTFLN